MLTGQKFGRYELRSKIGEGGMGEVYSAHDSELDRKIAIKLLPAEFTSDEERKGRFRQEARVVSSLNHPNIITIYEIGENEHGSFLVTEYVEGRTLREVMKRESLTLTRILKIVEQTANALFAAHAARIVHRDVKPENIMLRRDGIVKVLDFGLAKPTQEFGNGSLESNKTVPGTVMGSVRYMSPEQARGLAVDERTDIWSLGVVFYELLAGRTPFEGESTADIIAAVIYHEPEPIANLIPNVPPELQRILRKALQKDRDERYQSVKDFALDLKDLLYEIEHTNSGERAGHVTSSPEISENPTMIQHTISGNHPTGRTTAYTAIHDQRLDNRLTRKSPLTRFGAVAAALVLLAAVAFGLYSYFGEGSDMAADAFERPQISRINTDGRVNLPAISPDGKYIAYVSGEIGGRSIVVRQIATDSLVTVVPTTNLNFSALSFSPDGNYLYYCQTRSDFSVNTLYQIPTLGGTPKKLIEDIDSNVTFSPDGKQFAFMRHVSKDTQDIVFVVDTATLEMQPLITSKDTDFDFFSNRPAWSPDGGKILIGVGKRQSGFVGEMSIAEILVKEKTLRLINSGSFYTVGNLAWFADGSGFLFAARETLTSPVQIWRSSYPELEFHQVTNDFNDYAEVGLTADGRNISTIKIETSASLWQATPGGEARHISGDGRSPEGTMGLLQLPDGKLIYTRSEAKRANIWVSDADGRNARAVTSAEGWAIAPVATLDGRYIVFNLQEEKSSTIWRMDPSGNNRVRLTEINGNFADFNPQVTPDGRTVIFQRQFGNGDPSVLMSVPIDGGQPVVFYRNENRGVFSPRVSPDGKRMTFITYDTTTFEKRLLVATLESGSLGSIDREMEYNLITQVAWSPDGKTLTVLSSRAGIPNVFQQPLDGSEPKALTNFNSGRVFNFAWSADGKSLLLARGNTNNDLILIRDAQRSRAVLTRKSRIQADLHAVL